MMTSYLRDVDNFLRYRTLCTSIVKYGFPAKCTKLTQFVLFEVLRVPQLWGTSVYLGETSHSFWTQGISLFLLATGRIKKDLQRMEGFREAFIQRGWEGSERLVLWAVPEEEFLNNKINNRDDYVDYGST